MAKIKSPVMDKGGVDIPDTEKASMPKSVDGISSPVMNKPKQIKEE